MKVRRREDNILPFISDDRKNVDHEDNAMSRTQVLGSWLLVDLGPF
jgi:hypothetical protein